MKKYLDELLSDVPEKIGKSIELEEKCSEIAEKYKGSLTVSAKDGWFELRILIPIPESMDEI